MKILCHTEDFFNPIPHKFSLSYTAEKWSWSKRPPPWTTSFQSPCGIGLKEKLSTLYSDLDYQNEQHYYEYDYTEKDTTEVPEGMENWWCYHILNWPKILLVLSECILIELLKVGGAIAPPVPVSLL